MENTTEELKSHIQTDVDGAKQAVRYFESMKKAHEAIGELIDSQYDYAVKKLNELTQTQMNYEK